MKPANLSTLSVKIDSLHDKIDSIDKKYDERMKVVESENKANSEFRMQAKGIIVGVAAVFTIVLNGFFWVGNHFKEVFSK